MNDQDLQVLDQKIDALIKLCSQLDQENRQLKAEAQNWHHERESLIEKTETARLRVESMITRLKALEQQA